RAASTLAARAAASVRADPYAVVGTGLGAMSGALHGGASLGAETLMAAASGPDDVPRVVAELLRRGEKVPGFGHFVYRGGDPRAILLLDLVRRAAPKSGQLAVADALFAEQVGVAQVPRVLLDHVQVDQPQRHHLAVVGEGVVQRRVGRGRIGVVDLLGQPGVVGGGPGRVGLLEVGLRISPERVVDLL